MLNRENTDILKEFGKNLKHIRKQKALTQSQIAYLIGIESSAVSRIERGENITLTRLISLANALQIHPNKLFDFIQNINPTTN